MGLSLSAGLAVTAAVTAGAVVKGALGVGFPVVATPLAALVLDPETAVVALVLPSLVMNGLQAWQGRRFLSASDPLVRLLIPTLGTVVVGTVVGAYLLVALPTRAIAALVGASVMAYAILALLGVPMSLPPHRVRVTGAIVGFASGVLGGATGFFGLLLILYFAMLTLDKAKLPAIFSIVLVFGVVPQILSYVALGLLTGERLALSAIALVPAAVGFVIGSDLRGRMSAAGFALAIRITLLSVGAVLVWRAAAPWISHVLRGLGVGR
jgi:uncharacterized protein